MEVNYTIYQIKNVPESDVNFDYVFWKRKFRELDEEVTTVNFTKDNYKEVYSGFLAYSEFKVYRVLEYLYQMFNCEHPEDFRGHSLSVSDIVKVEDEYYHCQNCGWKKIERVFNDEV